MRVPLILAVTLVGCVDPDREVALPDDPVQSHVEIKEVPQRAFPRIDLLFVVDSAPTMAGEQDTLRANARAFVEMLRQSGAGLPDVHIGVVSSDLGTLGVDVGDPRCAGDGGGGRLNTYGCGVTDSYLADEADGWGERRQNYDGDLGDAVACILSRVGTSGCPWRQPLEALRRGLDDGERIGFLRDQADLHIVFIGDADDCSTADPALFAPGTPGDPRGQFRCFAHGVVCDGPDDPSAIGPRTGCRPRLGDPLLGSLDGYKAAVAAHKPEPRRIHVSAAMPPDEVMVVAGPRLGDSCEQGDRAGTAAVRMRAFVESFANRNTYTSICNDDWTEVLSLPGCLFARGIGTDAIGDDRIHAHLTIVEAELRAADVGTLTQPQRAARAASLDELHRYREARAYPRNENVPGVVPVFVDSHRARCAMADLIDHAGGASIVDHVAATRNNAYVRELVDEPELVAWLDRNGLTAAEAARVQPCYSHFGYPCIEGQPVDHDPTTPELQPELTAELRSWDVPSSTLALPPCNGHNEPCYRFGFDSLNCPPQYLSGYSIAVEPPFLPFDAVLHAEILVE